MAEPYKQWLCLICGFIYDEEQGWPHDGIAAGTRWEDVPEDWVCPDCLVGKADFEMVEITNQPETTAAISKPETTKPIGPIVIIGSGYAGYNLAEAIRQNDSAIEIVVLTADAGMHYSKPALSNGLLNGQQAKDLISEKPLAMANRLGMRIVTHCQAERIDPQAKIIHTNLGQQPYSQLVLATGAKPLPTSIVGDGAKDILSINNLADYDLYRQALAGKSKVLLIGHGLIGCEFANDLASSGVQVNLVGRSAWPMPRLVPQAIGQRLQSCLQAIGVNWYLQNTVAKIDYQIADQVDSGYRVTLNDGQILDVELVVSAIGLQAATELALTAGIACDKGIKVDKHLATNVASIYALGDAIEIDGQLMPYIAPIYWGIQALAKTLTGTRSEVNYPLMTVMVKTPTCPLSLLPVPVGIEGNWQIDSEDDGMVARFIDQKGRLQGFVLQGDKLDLRAQLLDQIKQNIDL